MHKRFHSQRKKQRHSRFCVNTHKKFDEKEPGLFEDQFRSKEMLGLCMKTFCCFNWKNTLYNLSTIGLSERTLEYCEFEPLTQCCKVLDAHVSVNSTNRGLRTIQDSMAVCEETKRRFSFFHPKRSVEDYGKLLQLWSFHPILCDSFYTFLIPFSTFLSTFSFSIKSKQCLQIENFT